MASRYVREVRPATRVTIADERVSRCRGKEAIAKPRKTERQMRLI